MDVGIGPPIGLSSVPGLAFSVSPTGHSHSVTGTTEVTPLSTAPVHTHPIRVKVSTTGSGPGTTVRGGLQLLYFKDLAITVGKKGTNPLPSTDKVLTYVKQNYSAAWNNQTSFNGFQGDPLYRFGTGPIRLDLIDGLSFEPDEFVPYEIKLSVVGSGNGGCIQYNLYVE